MANRSKICAFAICASGAQFIALKQQLIEQLKWYMPGVDIVDIDLTKARECIGDVTDDDLPSFARLAIPQLDQFKKYERVVCLDADTEVKSGLFAGILDVETSKDGLAACEDYEQQSSIDRIRSYLPNWAHTKYFNTGVMVMDLDKINVDKWRECVAKGLSMHATSPFLLRGQDLLNAFFEFETIDSRFNCLVRVAQEEERQAAWLWHYAGCAKPSPTPIPDGARQYLTVRLSSGNVMRWLRSYFAFGDGSPLAIVSEIGWTNAEYSYSKAAIEFCGGVLIDGNGRAVSDSEIRETLDGLHISNWRHIESDVDIQGQALAANAIDYPAAPFEASIANMAKNVKQWVVKPSRISDEEAIDAVFVIGTGSPNNNEELRYALRNLDKHCPFIRDVYISGECPDWVNKSVVKHLKWPDRFKHAKDANIIDKLRHACEQKGISKRILFCSDDQFQTHVCKWEDFFPRYLRQYKSEDTWYADCKRAWHTRLRDTLERDKQRRVAAKLDTSHIFYYEPHMWMQIDRDKFIEYAKWSDYEHRNDTIIASGYFNFVDADGHPHDKNYDHVFMGAGTKEMPKVTHIAYTDGGFERAKSFFNQLFPKKCRFEIGGMADYRVNTVQTKNESPIVKKATIQPAIQRPVLVAPPAKAINREAIVAPPVKGIDREAIRSAIRGRIFGKISL